MSIYATLWRVQFPRYGDDHTACEWVEVLAQGVPGHIGTPSPGHGYEDADPFADFLPPPIVLAPDDRGASCGRSSSCVKAPPRTASVTSIRYSS
jgi:hypothetical protein